VTLYERRRQAIANAVRFVSGRFQGQTRTQQTRDEFAASRKAEGWSPQLVDQATGAGPLAGIRQAIREDRQGSSKIVMLAISALGILDSGRRVETVYPHYGDDTLPLQRRTRAPARTRDI